MSSPVLSIDRFLEPISTESPGGVDVRFLPDWKKLQEFRRSDDVFNKGAWETKEQKVAEWDAARDFAAQLLEKRTKDLRIAVVYAEAKFQTEGLSGLVDGLRLVRELAVKFWDSGLFPSRDEDGGLTQRVGALTWLNEGLASALFTTFVTTRADQGNDYTYSQYVGAQTVGREKDYESGGSRYDKREELAAAKSEGRTLDLFDAAVRATPRKFYEALNEDLQRVETEVASLVTTINETFAGPALLTPLDDPDSEFERLNKLQEVLPGFSTLRGSLEKLRGLLDPVLEIKRKSEPDSAAAAAAAGAGSKDGRAAVSPALRFSASAFEAGGKPGNSGAVREVSIADRGDAWEEAASMVHSGKVEQGLSHMSRLAVSETSGRNRFKRKLMLAEICLQIKRDRLARTILEELAEQVEKHKLDEWEATDLVGGVWGNLYRIYRKDDQDKAARYFDRLCRLDPWQTLGCSEE